jgi:hypothetical protein
VLQFSLTEKAPFAYVIFSHWFPLFPIVASTMFAVTSYFWGVSFLITSKWLCFDICEASLIFYVKFISCAVG